MTSWTQARSTNPLDAQATITYREIHFKEQTTLSGCKICCGPCIDTLAFGAGVEHFAGIDLKAHKFPQDSKRYLSFSLSCMYTGFPPYLLLKTTALPGSYFLYIKA